MGISRVRRSSALLILVVACAASLTGSGSAASPEENPSGTYRPDLRPGDVLDDYGVGSVVPPPGHGVVAHAHGEGYLEGLRIETHGNGNVYVFGHGQGRDWEPDEQTSSGGGGGGSGECSEDGKDQAPFMERNSHPWRFNKSSTPTSDISGDSAELAIQEAGRNWAQLRNSCGYSDDVWASFDYKGTTSLGAGISGDGTSCLGSDGTSVVAFGNLDTVQDGAECSYYTLEAGWDELYESDVKLNSFEESWTVAPGSSSCSGDMDIEAVMTHERGHTLGFSHVNNDVFDHLTMSRYNEGACQSSERTLGKGDVLAIREKYRQ